MIYAFLNGSLFICEKADEDAYRIIAVWIWERSNYFIMEA